MLIPAKEVANEFMKCLEESVADFPEEEKEEAKRRILNALSAQMFYGAFKGDDNGGVPLISKKAGEK
jgi:hypothetical protein